MHGDTSAANALLLEVMPKLREIAVRQLKLERYVAPVSKTELINELWLSSLSKGGWQIRDQGHFYALASLAMRRVLIGLAERGSSRDAAAKRALSRWTSRGRCLEHPSTTPSASSKSAS